MAAPNHPIRNSNTIGKILLEAMRRHRLNRGDDRAANSALHIIAIGRLRTDPRAKAYMAKRMAEGYSTLEALRCLKRYIAREVFTLINQRQKEINQARIAT
jgi:hypothetical protein